MIYDRFTIFFFFFNDTATTEIYTLSLHDALPISAAQARAAPAARRAAPPKGRGRGYNYLIRTWLSARNDTQDRKSTRLNSSHANISYAVFCLKKKKKAKIVINEIQKTDIILPRP